MVPLMVFPWTLQWYLNSPSVSNFTDFDDLPGSISPVSNVLASSSDTAVCVVRDLLIHTTESPTLISSFLGSKLRLFIVTVIGLASAFLSPLSSSPAQVSTPARLNAQKVAISHMCFMFISLVFVRISSPVGSGPLQA